MRIIHVGLYVKDLEKMKDFYCQYFGGEANERYTNETKGFASYFITFNEGTRLELMTKDNITTYPIHYYLGLAHIAFSLGSKDKVNTLTKRFKDDGYTVDSGPRETGDGYYESVVFDPEGNAIELTV